MLPFPWNDLNRLLHSLHMGTRHSLHIGLQQRLPDNVFRRAKERDKPDAGHSALRAMQYTSSVQPNSRYLLEICFPCSSCKGSPCLSQCLISTFRTQSSSQDWYEEALCSLSTASRKCLFLSCSTGSFCFDTSPLASLSGAASPLCSPESKYRALHKS